MRIDKIEVKQQIPFVAITSSTASNNSIFLDSSDNKMKQKDNAGVVTDL